MIIKILKFIRFLIIGTIWSYVFIALSNFMLVYFWNFNLFSTRSWQTISYFWEAGGVIKSAKDYFFLFILFSLPWIWLLGWKKLHKVNFIEILLLPITLYNRHIIKKYGHKSAKIMLKNLKSSQQMIEEIKNQLESIKPEKPQEVANIREEIEKQITSSQNK